MAFSGYSSSTRTSATSDSRWSRYGGHPNTFPRVEREYQWRPRRRDDSSSSSSAFTETRTSGRHQWRRGWHSHRSSRSRRGGASDASNASTGDARGPRGGWNSRSHGRGDKDFDWWAEYRDTERPGSLRRTEGSGGTRPPGRGISRRWGRFTDPDSFSSGSEEDWNRRYAGSVRHTSLRSGSAHSRGRRSERYRYRTSRPRWMSRSSSSGDSRWASSDYYYGRRRSFGCSGRRRSRERERERERRQRRYSSESSTSREGRRPFDWVYSGTEEPNSESG